MKKSSLIGVVLAFMIVVQPIYGCTNKDSNSKKDGSQNGNNNYQREITTIVTQSGKVITRDSNDDHVLEVIMELTRENYNSMGFSSSSPIAYHVKMKITNKGKLDIKYDRIFSGFIPPRGKALEMQTYPFVSGARATDSNPFTLVPGKTEEYDFTTNGYTMDLLANANGQPLVFVMILLRGEEVVYKTQQVALPPVGDLPSYELTMFGNDVKPLTKKITP